MNAKYNSITDMLKNNKHLFLQIHHYERSGGLKNARYVALWESNPNKGQIAHPESSQQFVEGEVREKPGFDFKAKDTLEGLKLLERACAGSKNVKNTVQESWPYHNIPEITGHPTPQGNLDGWIYGGFKFIIHQNTEYANLFDAQIVKYFFETDNIIIASNKFKTVDEGVEYFDNIKVSNETIHHLRRGLLLDNRIRKHSEFVIPERNLLVENAFNSVSPKLREKYLEALDEIHPLNTNNQCRNAVFLSMLLSKCYDIDPEERLR